MLRRLLASATAALALTGCITYEYVQAPGPQYRDGSYYYPADDGYGDYYAAPASPYDPYYDEDPYERWFYGYGGSAGHYWHPYEDRYGWFGGYGADRCGYDWRGDWRCWDRQRGWRGSISYGRGWGWGSSWLIYSSPWPSYGWGSGGYYGGGSYWPGYYPPVYSRPRTHEPRPVNKPVPVPGSVRPDVGMPITGPRTQGEYARGGGFPRSAPTDDVPMPPAVARDKPQAGIPMDNAPPPGGGMRYQLPSQRGEPSEPAMVGRAFTRPRDLGRDPYEDAQPRAKPQPAFNDVPVDAAPRFEEAPRFRETAPRYERPEPRYERPEPREQPRFEEAPRFREPEPRFERSEPREERSFQRFERPEPREAPRFERPEPREEPRFERFERPEPREEPRFERPEPAYEPPAREEREDEHVE